MKRLFLVFFLLSAAVSYLPDFGGPADATGASQKPTAEEIIRKHLDSIATAEKRAALGARVVAGSTQVTFRARGIAQTEGLAVLASDGPKSMVTMKFEGNQYPYEKVGFDGDKVTAYQLRPGDYTSLGSFMRSSPEILKDGLMGGTLSSAWPLLDFANRKAKLEYAGTKKINSRQALEVRYLPRGGSDLKISMFFDAETFQHVRTTYKKAISAQMAGQRGTTQTGTDRTGEATSGQTSTTYELVEDFSDFKTEEGVTLPRTYKIHLAQQGISSQISDWVMTLVQFLFNQKLDAKDFDVSH